MNWRVPGCTTVALRMPGHPVALELIRAFGRPLAAPSANRSGRISPTTAQDVVAELGEQAGLVLDAGPAQVGLESTIVAVLPGEPCGLLRPGGVSREALLTVVDEISERRPNVSKRRASSLRTTRRVRGCA